MRRARRRCLGTNRRPPARRSTSRARSGGCAARWRRPRRPIAAPASTGFDPQPGLSLLRLSQGRTAAAATSVRRALGATRTGSSAPGCFRRTSRSCWPVAGSRRREAPAVSWTSSPAHSTPPCCAPWPTTRKARSRSPKGNPLAGLEVLRRAWKAGREIESAVPDGPRARAGGAVRPGAGRRRRLRWKLRRRGRSSRGSARAGPRRASMPSPARGGRRRPTRADRPRGARCCASSPPARPTRRSRPTLSLSEKTVERHVSNICTKLDVPRAPPPRLTPTSIG